jgi:hypothetical protein
VSERKNNNGLEGTELFYTLFLLMITFMGLSGKYRGADFKQTDVWCYERPMKLWVKANTAEGDKFLIPLYINSWQSTKRPALYDVNVINAASYNKAFIGEAMEGFQALTGINLKTITEKEMEEISPLKGDWWRRMVRLNENYDNLSTERILALRDNYGIKYFVTASQKSYEFPVVYENGRYIIYEVGSIKRADNHAK